MEIFVKTCGLLRKPELYAHDPTTQLGKTVSPNQSDKLVKESLFQEGLKIGE